MGGSTPSVPKISVPKISTPSISNIVTGFEIAGDQLNQAIDDTSRDVDKTTKKMLEQGNTAIDDITSDISRTAWGAVEDVYQEVDRFTTRVDKEYDKTEDYLTAGGLEADAKSVGGKIKTQLKDITGATAAEEAAAVQKEQLIMQQKEIAKQEALVLEQQEAQDKIAKERRMRMSQGGLLSGSDSGTRYNKLLSTSLSK